ncbi:C-type lectin domain family 4 member M-like [Asterias amurensis]|uniref:C-type lectin domain family 4 member M-like n=1 Tax=Asterias amurensis TaxID=7602 RepID=UPI003AB73949
MLANKLLGVVGIFLMANYAAVKGRCWKPCPPTWSQWQDKCYKMRDAVVTWEEGKQICVELDGVMVVPQSKEEFQHLVNMTSGQWFWIGCNDIQTEGTWVCLDGEGTIDTQDKRWVGGQPDNNSNEDCAEGWATGWNDDVCGTTRKLICQRPVLPALLPL